MSAPPTPSQRLYLATLSVDVLVYVEDPPAQIGGRPTTHDEAAAWGAMQAVSLIAGDDCQQRIDEGGYPLTIAQAGCTRLRKIKPGGEVEPDYHKTKSGKGWNPS